jgi:D-lactate dehydrogenase
VDVAVFSAKPYDRAFLDAANQGHRLVYHEAHLGPTSAVLADGCGAVCIFVNDVADRATLEQLQRRGVRLIALRCAGFNNVDLVAARELGQKVVRVPAYSPHAVAEHTLAMILALNRKIHKAYNRVRENNFALDGLLGFDLSGRTAGLIGTGAIGTCTARILQGFGCTVLAHDPFPSAELEAAGVRYVGLEELFEASDIVSLHCPLTPDTHHLVGRTLLERARPGFMLINTSRGALLDTRAAIAALKSGRIGALGLDVYEEEADLFFEDLSHKVIHDDVFSRLLTFPNVLVTAHQAFFTEDALTAIAETTLASIGAFEQGGPLDNEISIERLA